MKPNLVREEKSSYHNSPVDSQDSAADFSEIQIIYKRLVKSGNAERFYASFYSTIVSNAVKYFQGLSRNAATLLSTKVADCMLVHSKEKVENSDLSTCPIS